MAIPPEIIERAKKMREALKSNPALVEELIGKLSAGAQGPARQISDIFLGDVTDPAALKAEIEKIKGSLPEEIKKELDEHRHDLSDKLGLPRMQA